MSETKRIFFIEDDTNLQKAVTEFLHTKGFQVMPFHLCHVAFERLQQVVHRPQERPGLLVVNDLMPDQLGRDLCRQIRSLKGYEQIPIVVLTLAQDGQTSPSEEGKEDAWNALLPKPIGPIQLFDLISSLLPVSGSEAEEVTEPDIEDEDDSEDVPLQPAAPRPRKDVSLSGELSEEDFALPQVLCHYFRQESSGALHLKTSEIWRTVFFEKGNIILAKSDASGDGIKALIKNKGLLTDQQIKDAEVVCQENPDKFFSAIMEMKLLEPHQLFELVEEQTRNIIFSTFLWENGQFEFKPGDLLGPDQMRLQINFSEILFKGISLAFDENRMLDVFLDGLCILAPTPSLKEGLQKLRLGPKQTRTASLADGSKMVLQVMEQSPLPGQETLQILYALYCLRHLEMA